MAASRPVSMMMSRPGQYPVAAAQQQQQQQQATIMHRINEHRNTKIEGTSGYTGGATDPRRSTIYKNMQQAPPAITTSVVGGSAVGVGSRKQPGVASPKTPGTVLPLREGNLALLNNSTNADVQQQQQSAPSAVGRQSRASPANATATPSAANTPPQPPQPADMKQAMVQFDQAKKEAQRRVRVKMSAKSRLVNAFADLTVVLLTRAMMAGAHDKVEVRIYKKPSHLGSGTFAVAEYREVKTRADKKLDKKQQGITSTAAAAAGEQTSDDDFIVLTCGELLPGEAGQDKDTIEHWRQFADVIDSMGLWWRFCMAVHKRIGWKVQLERGILNVIDSRMLGFVTLKISNFI